MNRFDALKRGTWSIFVICLFAFGFAGCEGDDGAQGPPGPQGDQGPPGADGEDGADASQVALETCGVCHSENSFASAKEAHAVTGVPTVSDVLFTDVAGDLQVTYNLLIDGAPVDDFLEVDSAYVYTAADGLTNTIDQLVNPIAIAAGTGGDFTATITGGTALAGAAGRFFLRVVNTAADTRAVVSGDFPAATFPAIVADASCNNCHGPAGVAPHTAFGYPGMVASQCVVCHKAEGGNPVFFPGGVADFNDPFVGIIHGIHNAHDFPEGFYEYDPEHVFDTTYPTYMPNCSVCHSEAAQLAAANAMTVSGPGCLSCHGAMENEYWDFTAVPFHLTNIPDPDTFDCATGCHEAGGLAAMKIDVTDFHNGIVTGNDGIIFDGVDTSVTEGEKFVWEITDIADDGTNLTITWQASYEGAFVDPCNATVGPGTPVFHAGDGSLRTYRNYAQGEDFILGQDDGGPGQPVRVNVTTDNTTCEANIATTVIPVEDVDAERGRIALGGKPLVPSVLDPAQAMEVRVPSPTFDWLVGVGGAAPERRAIVDTGLCLQCHVGSLYQHGGDRVDNVDYCLLCHNSASNEQNVRVGMGVDASEAYDGKVGETFELKTMLHRIHSAGSPGSPPYLVYRNRGIYAFAPDVSLVPNWEDGGTEGCTAEEIADGERDVFGSDPTSANSCQPHNFHAPTYPRALNDCAACHSATFASVIPDQTKAMATTIDAGGEEWLNQLDDTLQGAATTACITCHKDGASKGHAYQNSWVPQVFPDGRQTVIDAVR